MNDPAAHAQAQAQANAVAGARIAACRPKLRELVSARHALDLRDGELGHAGPPYDPGQAPSAVVLSALAAAAVHEGWAGSVEQGRSMVLDGNIRLRDNHSMGIVSPMAGVVRPSQPLFSLEDAASGAIGFATLAERGRRVLRFGHYGQDVAAGLEFVETTVAEAVLRALPAGGLDLLPLLAKGIELGDDAHQRNVGGMLAFVSALGPLPMPVRDWLLSNPQHFLNYAMATAKMSLDCASGVRSSTVVTAISRNGIDCGIKLAGLPAQWFKAPAAQPAGRWFDGHGPADAHLDLGDSAIMETFGLGGCIAHASPETAAAMDCSWQETRMVGRAMRGCFLERHAQYSAALAGDDGVGLGLDAARVVAAGIGVRIHTGIAHADGHTGWIGIGVATAPLACFKAAVAALHGDRNTAERLRA